MLLESPDDVIGGIGDIFTMKMHNGEMGDYVIANHVVEYEPGRRIGWEPVLAAASRPEDQGDTGALASTLVATWQGAILSWAAMGQGNCGQWVIARLNSVLDLHQLQPDRTSEQDGLMDELLASGLARVGPTKPPVGQQRSRE